MALTLLFADGFDTYDHSGLINNSPWSTPGTDTTIDLTGTVSRSGLGCLKILSSAFGPKKVLSANQTNFIASGAFNPGGVIPSNNGEIFRIEEAVSGLRLTLNYLPDLSLALSLDAGAFFGNTAPAQIDVNVYNFIAIRAQFGHSGSIRVWVNGTVRIDIPTVDLQPPLTNPYINTCQLMCFGGTTTGLWDDVSFWSWSDPAVDQFAYAPSVYPAMPVSDSAPLNWTPSTGVTHFNLVNAVPEQTTTYNSDGSIGDIDQYIHAIPNNQKIPPLPGTPAVLGVYHMMLAELDVAGARSIASNKAGVQGPTSFPLTTSYVYYGQPYTPGLAHYTDLPTTAFGPEVSA